MKLSLPRIMVAGACGDGGKTMVALGLTAAFTRRGRRVAVFKKGPDYIDAAWLGRAGEGECGNLDTYLMPRDVLLQAFAERGNGADLAIVEANRGVHDGSDASGAHSSAELAKLLKMPVVLVLDATKTTRTLGAIALGIKSLDPATTFAGVVLNRVAGERHARVASKAIEEIAGLAVLGSIPKLADARRIPGRHLGLLPIHEYDDLEGALAYAADVMERHVDLDRIEQLAGETENLSVPECEMVSVSEEPVRIGVLRDGAFSFYYPENLEALEKNGATLIAVDSVSDRRLPQLDALYIGGGFPETHAERLTGNSDLRYSISVEAAKGLPIYAECGGLMYLAESIEWQGKQYPMCGVLPIQVAMHTKPKGHGYADFTVDRDNPFFDVGQSLKGHEFHYSQIVDSEPLDVNTAFALSRGSGIGKGRDGILRYNTLACYTHVHALTSPLWAKGLVKAARRYANERSVQGLAS